MQSFISKIIIDTFLSDKHKKNAPLSEKEMDKGVNAFIINTKRIAKDFLFIIIGITAAGFGLKSFLLPNKFIDGGTMGIALLMYELTHLPLPFLIVIINLPFILLGAYVFNKKFAFKTILAIIALAVTIAVVPFPEVTNDKLLISIFGGFFLGAGIGLSMRGGAVLDGSEILAIFVSRSTANSIGDIIMIINIVIFSFAAYLLSIETAMYAMLTYISAAKTVDFIIEGFEEYMGVTIISDYCEEVCNMLKNDLQRGYTIYIQKKGSGKRGERAADAEIVYTVITRLEIGKLYSELEKIDPNAFIITQSVKNIKGGLVKKRPLEMH